MNRTASFVQRAALIALLLMPLPLRAQQKDDIDKAVDTNFGDHSEFQQVMADLQVAVAKHDATTVAALVQYPITINPRTSKAMRIQTPKAFIANYNKIITPAIADIITKQKYEDLFVNSQGAMLGNGQVWLTGICRDKECKQVDIKIKTIQSTVPSNKLTRPHPCQ